MSKQNHNAFSITCPAHGVLAKLLNKWTGLVVRCLSMESPLRHSELKRAIGGISQKMLTQTLRELEADGLVEREVYPVVPPKVEYRLTELGRSLVGPLVALGTWVEDHIEEIEVAQAQYVQERERSA